MNLVDKGFGLAVFLGAIVTACSAPTIPNDLSGNEGNQTANAPKKDKSSPTQNTDSNEPAPNGEQPGSSPTPDGGAPPAGDCAASASADACYTCCDPTNATEAAFIAFDTCACQTPGVCKTECGANYCLDQAPTPACETCLNGATQCQTAGDAACGAACQAAFQCEDTSKCDEKP